MSIYYIETNNNIRYSPKKMLALLESQNARPWAIVAAVVVAAISFFVWKMFDSRLFDLDGKRIPGPETHFGKKR